MTYPEIQTQLEASRTKLQGANNRIAPLTSDIADAVSQEDGLFGQIPEPPIGGYTTEPSEEFVAEAQAWSDLVDSIEARIPS